MRILAASFKFHTSYLFRVFLKFNIFILEKKNLYRLVPVSKCHQFIIYLIYNKTLYGVINQFQNEHSFANIKHFLFSYHKKIYIFDSKNIHTRITNEIVKLINSAQTHNCMTAQTQNKSHRKQLLHSK